MKEIKINTDSKNYSVLVGSEILNQENFKEFSEREILLVIDSNIDLKVKNNVKERLERISSKFAEITLDASEENNTQRMLILLSPLTLIIFLKFFILFFITTECGIDIN